MKEAAGLGAMRVGDARIAMRPDAEYRETGCTACHQQHAFDTRRAAVDSCLSCHADEHSLAYRDSEHARLFAEDPTGRRGASCATCHLPRVEREGKTHVVHNQNDTLRPNEKAVRPVCMSCHGVGFALAALADGPLVRRNFRGRPKAKLESLEMVRARNASN